MTPIPASFQIIEQSNENHNQTGELVPKNKETKTKRSKDESTSPAEELSRTQNKDKQHVPGENVGIQDKRKIPEGEQKKTEGWPPLKAAKNKHELRLPPNSPKTTNGKNKRYERGMNQREGKWPTQKKRPTKHLKLHKKQT